MTIVRAGGRNGGVMSALIKSTPEAITAIATMQGIINGGLAEQVRAAITAPVQMGERNVYLSVAIGVSRPSTEAFGPDDLQEQAATALHDLQREGKTGIRVFEDGIEHVLELMETFINHSVIVGVEPEYIRAVEEMLEDIRNTLDNT